MTATAVPERLSPGRSAGHQRRRPEIAERAKPLFERLKAGDADCQNSGLGVEGVVQFFLWPFEAQSREREAEDRVGLFKDSARGGRGFVQLLAHPHVLGSLPREDKGDLGLHRIEDVQTILLKCLVNGRRLRP